MVRSWALMNAEGEVVKERLRMQPQQARELLDDFDRMSPSRAPHTLALAGGDDT